MARTIQQIETDIDNSTIIKIKEYLKDYLVEQLNIVVSDVDDELQKIFTAVNGLENIAQTIPKPQEPAATDPATGNDGDLFFNTTDKWLKYYHNGTWHNLAQLSALVDLTPYAKTADVDIELGKKATKVEVSVIETKVNTNITDIATIKTDKADKATTYTTTQIEAMFEKKSTNLTPTVTQQAGFIILDETNFKSATPNTRFRVDLSELNNLGNPPADADRLFIGINGAVMENTAGADVYLKFVTKTNSTDWNIKDNFSTKDLLIEKISNDKYMVQGWVDKTQTFSDDLTWKTIKQDKIIGKPAQVLAAEVFTAALKTKLEGLSNEDKASILSKLGLSEADLAPESKNTLLTKLGITDADLTKIKAIDQVFTAALKTKLEGLSVEDKASILTKLTLTDADLTAIKDLITKKDTFAKKDLTDVNVGTANAGKIFQVKDDGTIEYVDKPSGGAWVDYTEKWKGGTFNMFLTSDKTPPRARMNGKWEGRIVNNGLNKYLFVSDQWIARRTTANDEVFEYVASGFGGIYFGGQIFNNGAIYQNIVQKLNGTIEITNYDFLHMNKMEVFE